MGSSDIVGLNYFLQAVLKIYLPHSGEDAMFAFVQHSLTQMPQIKREFHDSQ